MTLPGDEGNRELYFLCKRSIDVALSALLLALLAPLLCLIAVVIKLDTAGPVLFVQERVGARRRFTRGRTTWEDQTFSLLQVSLDGRRGRRVSSPGVHPRLCP